MVAVVPTAAGSTLAVAAPGVGGSWAPSALAVAAPGASLRSASGHTHREEAGLRVGPVLLDVGCASVCAARPSSLRSSMPGFDLPLRGRCAGRHGRSKGWELPGG
jgi:hypothetical protein